MAPTPPSAPSSTGPSSVEGAHDTTAPAEEHAAQALLDAVFEAGTAAGLTLMGVTTAEILEPAATVVPQRKAQGLHADMAFTYRNPSRSTDPSRTLPSAKSLIAGVLDYYEPDPETGPSDVNRTSDAPVWARVARYTWADYYERLRIGLRAAASVLTDAGYRALVHADSNAITDRNVIYRSGLGWYGKNANILIPGHGSWVVLGTIVTDAELPAVHTPIADGCGSCRQCLQDCPTEAIVGPGIIDARRCLAWLVQARGGIPRQFREAVADRIYGCDTCQDVCPVNHGVVRSEERTTIPVRIGGPNHPAPIERFDHRLDVMWLLTLSDEDLMAEVGRWYLADRNPNVVRRTGLIVLGNVGEPNDATVALLERYMDHPDPMLRSHTVWAAFRLGLGAMVAHLRDDPEAEVRAEFMDPPAPRAAVALRVSSDALDHRTARP